MENGTIIKGTICSMKLLCSPVGTKFNFYNMSEIYHYIYANGLRRRERIAAGIYFKLKHLQYYWTYQRLLFRPHEAGFGVIGEILCLSLWVCSTKPFPTNFHELILLKLNWRNLCNPRFLKWTHLRNLKNI